MQDVIASYENEIAALKLQIREAMGACPVSGHEYNHKEPRHCIAALHSILQMRDTEKRDGE